MRASLRLPFEEAVVDVSAGNIKTLQASYQPNGHYAVVDQGKSLVSGYVNDAERLCKAELPVIVFGDHTRCFKFIDFPFCMGADGVKVLRPRTPDLDPKYLYHFLRQLRLPDGGYDRHFKYLKRESVPLPPLADQRRLAAILDQAEALRAQRRAAIAQLDSLGQAIFVEMFGNPVSNPRALKMVRLGDLGEWRSGGTPPRGTTRFFQGHIPWFSSGELNSMYVSDAAEHISEAALEETAAKRVPAGALMLGMYDTAALKASISTVDCACNQAIAFSLLNPERADPVYVYFAIEIGREHFRRLQRGVRQKNLNLSMVRDLSIPLPSTKQQSVFADRVQALQEVRARSVQAVRQLDGLFASLQYLAFRGELSRRASTLEDLQTLEAEAGLEALIFVAKRTARHDLYVIGKTLYMADRHHLEQHGRLVYGETHEALPMGPVPKAAYDTVKFLRGEQIFGGFDETAARAAIRVEDRTRLVPLREADLGKLGAEAVQSLEWAIRYFANASFEQAKAATHDAAWQKTTRSAPIALRDIIETLPAEARRRHWPEL